VRKTGLALIPSLFLIQLPALAADSVQYGPASPWVQPVAVPVNDSTMAEAPVKFLLRSHQIRFTTDSTEIYTESFVRLQTPQGLQGLGNFALPWKPHSDQLTVHKLQILRDGKVIDLLADGQKFEVMRRENNLEYAALDGVLTAAVQPNGLEVGDVFTIAFSLKREDRLVAPEYVFGGLAEVPLSRVEIRATWDKGVPMRWKASPEITGVKEMRRGNTIELTWSSTSMGPITQPNGVPARFWKDPRIEFSAYASWQEASRRLAPLYAKAVTLSASSPIREEARKIAADSKDPVARLEAALQVVQDRIRYVFLGMGDGGINPAGVDETWTRRFGDCKAKSALLIALLGELGIPAESVAVNTFAGDAVSERLPMLGNFNHVIVRARAAGSTWWLDGTAPASWRRDDMTIPNYSWGLPLTAQGDALVRMLAPPFTTPRVEVETFIDAKAGIYTNAPFRVKSRIRGMGGAALHSRLAGLTPVAREQAQRKYWTDQYDFVDVVTVAEEFDDRSGVVTLSMEGTAKMDWGGSSYTTDGTRAGYRADFEREPGINVDAPYSVAHPAYQVTRQRIELPPGARFTKTGKDYDVTLAGYRYRRTTQLVDNVFTGESLSFSLVPEITAAEARAAEKPLNDMWQDKVEIGSKGYEANDADIAGLRTRKYDDVGKLIWRGNLLLDRNDYDAAYLDFDAAAKLEKKTSRGLAHRGLTHYWRQKHDEARRDFDAALEIDPKNAVALRGLGALQVRLGDEEAAIKNCTESLKYDPDNGFALSTRAHAYFQAKDEARALADSAEAVRLSPTFLDVHDLRGWLLMRKGDAETVLRETEAMLEANPGKKFAWLVAARNFHRAGNGARALAAMEKVIADNPTADDYLARARIRDPADSAGRMADLDAAIAKQPDFPRAKEDRAREQMHSGDFNGAIATYDDLRKGAKKQLEKRRLSVLRGIAYSKSGQAPAARRDFAQALADGPDGDSFRIFCWELAAAKVELEQALAACKKALAAAPRDATYLDAQGLVLLQLERHDEAISAYDAAIAIDSRPESLIGRGIARNRRCKCSDGDADLKAARLLDSLIERRMASMGLAP
jgi:tetratricopeptide (TPR) repeat protein